MRYELNDDEWSAIKPMLPNDLERRGATCRTTSVRHYLLQSLRSLAARWAKIMNALAREFAAVWVIRADK